MSPRRRRRPRRLSPVPHSTWYGLGLIALGLAVGVLSTIVILFEGAPLTAPRPSAGGRCAFEGQHVWEDGRCYPAERDDCEQRGGVWGLLGGQQYGCNFVAADAGERCDDGADCESGHCLAILDATTQLRLTEATAPIPANGICAGLHRLRGCNAELADGTISTLVCR